MHDAVLSPGPLAYSSASRTRSRPGARRRRGLLAGGAAAVLLAGAGAALSYTHRSAAETAAAMAPPARIPVGVQTLAERPLRLWSEFPGRLSAVDAAELRPQVSGRITEVRFADGQAVRAGDVLFVIDPRPYEAAVARAEASLAAARTNLSFAATELDRARVLIRTEAIAQRLYDQLANAQRVAEATVRGADAELREARLDLEHAHVRAPISGRASRAELTVGNLVQSGPGAPLLTSIVSSDGIYADFQVDEQTYLGAIRSQARGREQERAIPVELALASQRGWSQRGTIHAFDNRIDPASGTIRARARFQNADGVLVPGMFVTVRLGGGEQPALLVSERAIGTDQSKKFVYVVGADGEVAYREVELGPAVDGQRVVRAGLAAGERVVVDGVQHVKPSSRVEPSEVPIAARSARSSTELAAQQ